MKEKPSTHLDWGLDGIKAALDRNDIVLIVDVLRFSSAVVTAVANGFVIYPSSDRQKGEILAASENAEISGKSGFARFSLSPSCFIKNRADKIKKVVLCSPNGAACSELIGCYDKAFVGSLLNAESIGRHLDKLAIETGQDISIIAAGEQRTIEIYDRVEYVKKPLQKVFAVEDYLGCGAVISHLTVDKKPEAILCEAAFSSCRARIKQLLYDCPSGRYLIQKGFSGDIDHCSSLNYYDTIPMFRNGSIS